MEPLVTIAIPHLAGPTALSTTLAALARHTPEPHMVVLLVEAGSTQTTMHNTQTLQQISVPAPFATPTALNQLLAVCTTPYILLLESGAIVTSGWLSRLLEPLTAANVGLSGPSTNSCWNEQQVQGTNMYWSAAQIDHYAAQLAVRYAHHQQALDILHSLNDFCYLFKCGVAEQIGGFDEAYGPGPCWEIDFNTRAARAGFQAVWVASAYVHRAPVTLRHKQILQHYFTSSKHLYQDRFCGLRLRGAKQDYETHCRGEACEHFAPATFIQVKLNTPLVTTPAQEQRIPITPAQEWRQVPTSSTTLAADMPLVSCIMPTYNRRAFVRQALLYFERQDYPNKELVIVDDGDDPVADLVAFHPQVRYIALPQKQSIGEKRNIACTNARGAIIAHWDDDDWYAPHRLSYQIAPLLAQQADLTALTTSCFFDISNWQAWTCSPELHRRLFVQDVHGGTLVYWRKLWGAPGSLPKTLYPRASLAEDAIFLQTVCRRGARLQKLPHANSFVYVRHGSNAWQLVPGKHVQSTGWQRTDPSSFLPPADLRFYASFSSPIATLPSTPTLEHSASDTRVELQCITSPLPLVSCIMPTYNRRPFIKQAINYFLRQDYPHKELIVVDDGTDAISDLLPPDPRIRYIRLPTKTILGTKRNLACEQAQGTIIAHWDDDDWHAPHRLRYQVEALLRNDGDVCGIDTILFYNIVSGQAWQYVYPANQRAWVSGSTLCYQRAFWVNNRFESISVGEDARFVWRNARVRVKTLPDNTFHVGIIHGHNTSPKRITAPLWRPYPAADIRSILGDDLAELVGNHNPS